MTTVKELIAKLSDLDPNMRVIVPSYEGGFDDVGEPCDMFIAVDANVGVYQGPHKENNINPDETAILLAP